MMSAQVQGKLEFVSNGTPAAMMERVQAMVGELAALGVTPRVTVTVDLMGLSSSGVITAGTVTSVPAAPSISTQMAPMPRSTERPSLTGDGDGDGVVSGVSMSSGEDFLGGAGKSGRRGEGESNGSRDNPPYVLPKEAVKVLQVDGVDWSSGNPYLSPESWTAVTDLENGVLTWRKMKKPIRLELLQKVLAQPTESGKAMTMGVFDRVKPAWMPAASSLPTTFGCAWSELPGLRLDV